MGGGGEEIQGDGPPPLRAADAISGPFPIVDLVGPLLPGEDGGEGVIQPLQLGPPGGRVAVFAGNRKSVHLGGHRAEFRQQGIDIFAVYQLQPGQLPVGELGDVGVAGIVVLGGVAVVDAVGVKNIGFKGKGIVGGAVFADVLDIPAVVLQGAAPQVIAVLDGTGAAVGGAVVSVQLVIFPHGVNVPGAADGVKGADIGVGLLAVAVGEAGQLYKAVAVGEGVIGVVSPCNANYLRAVPHLQGLHVAAPHDAADVGPLGEAAAGILIKGDGAVEVDASPGVAACDALLADARQAPHPHVVVILGALGDLDVRYGGAVL